MSGAMAISGLLKQQASKRTFDSIMNGILDTNDATSLESNLSNINKGTGSVFTVQKNE
jgi:hypothetical protein